ncbi:MAG: hypothetical protein E5X67_36645 [Mesorhizobium sp.]|uniref:hypothetical protein n=1 Tax=Mesorhizobium sp. TaxID=1871066 RepID=UPI001211AD7B|nr:hypothetical protein [Mesorhizobium sp.]TIP22567.1 MAG: hypothetical protein E5X67_36645 [Mesorhizobium sp.]
MAKRDRDGHKTLAEAVRELIGTEDNRRHVNNLLGLEVEPELPPTLASLLEAIGKASRDE